MNRTHILPNRRHLLAGGAATAATLAAPAIVRALGSPLKVGILLPLTGYEADDGQGCQRGIAIAPPILRSLGLPEFTIMNGDTESSVATAREHAEKLIGEGAELLVGAFDSGQTVAIAQVAEQRGIPLVVNLAAAPQITEQGYKYVFRNFPTGPMIVRDSFINQQAVFAEAGVAPKRVVYLHVNDTFGTAISNGVHALLPKFNMPYTIVEEIAYDPAARDLSVEVTKTKAASPDTVLVSSHSPNDAILLTRELVKQRWTPQAIFSVGPGWYEDEFLATLGKLSDGPINFVPWYDPTKKLSKELEAAYAKAYPGKHLNTEQVFSFEALLIAADAYKRAGSTDPKALAAALRTTNITDNVSVGPGIKFNAKGQNEGVQDSAVQNRSGKLVTVAPKQAADAKVQWPMQPYPSRV